MEELEKKLRKLFDDYDIFDDYDFYDDYGRFPDVEDYIKVAEENLTEFSKYLLEIAECEDDDSDLVQDINIIVKEIERLVK